MSSRGHSGRWLKTKRGKMKLFILLLLFIIPNIYLIAKYIYGHGGSFFPRACSSSPFALDENSITRIKNSEHFAVSAFIDHRIDKAIRVISIIKRDSKQSLYCVYGDGAHDWRFSEAEVEIHADHFGFPFAATDLLCHGEGTQDATHVAVSTSPEVSNIPNTTFLPIKNRVHGESFKFNFTVCVSSLFGRYNNVLQFAQTMEMYKLLGVQRVVIYNTSCGPDLEKLLQYYKKEGILEIVPWPIDQFLTPSSGWNFQMHGGDLHYYGQLVTLNECIYRNMYRSKYVLLNDIDEIIMPYKHKNLESLMDALQQEHQRASVFLFENHVFPKTQFDHSGRFSRPEWKNVPGVNIMEHVYREPDDKNTHDAKKMIIDPRKVFQTSVHASLNYTGDMYEVPFNVSRSVHVRRPEQANLTRDEFLMDTRVWDFERELVPNVDRVLLSSGLL
ncbi:beta-1,4-galactosyltransferase galt-1-like isoform X2 [Trichomycterus rosablanca]|uniref:beta-1,4-galactosyltransferase galt-1-like isoform X2 n=1 Tax=Trichomycterus rosablanca TaxID=2290929 RepID=UPI002F35B2C2